MINVKVSQQDLKNLDHFSSVLYKDLKKAGLVALSESMTDVAKGGVNRHRYKRRSGDLQRATQTDKIKDGYKAYINDGIVSYGSSVHSGHGTWQPDEFLYESFDREKKNIFEKVMSKINRVIKVFNG